MSPRRISAKKFAIFALAPAFALVLTAETTVRLKFFFAHGHDWNYLTMPFVRGTFGATDRWMAPKDQVVVNWQKPCQDRAVYSNALHREAPRTFDENCFRGDRVKQQKAADEYRVIFVGGSTVEDAQSDDEMMTAQFKRVWPGTYRGKRITVVNAGKPGFQSRLILLYWGSWVRTFSPDLVVYYEAWNEIPTDVKWASADRSIAEIGNRVHKALYYRSLLYTYLVEKLALRATSRERFWKIDLAQLRTSFTQLVSDVRSRRARFVFVTQVIRFPRMWKGVDTFDYHAVGALLDRMKADGQYVYDMKEISALNQRLALFYTIDLCHTESVPVPVIDILEPVEALGDRGRDEIFMDLGHLTVKGDQLVGRLIAERLSLPD
ncbi:MAG: hypothetical protein HY047_21620 [Acidobacteria bacterium]|nr:hypothetical protein [Acidobacteriota bacterium]